MEPLVSIITPCYNSEKYIRQTIESVLKQTYKNFEMIIVDDISTDKSVEIIKEYQKKDSRIKLFEAKEKIGASGARNLALRKMKGKYAAFLDSDDLWAKEKLEIQVKFMEENNVDFSYTDYGYVDEQDNILDMIRISPNKTTHFSMLIGDSLGCLTIMYNATKCGVMQIPSLKKRNDYALWCMVLKKLKKGKKCPGILAWYRKSSNSLSAGKKSKLVKYHYKVHRTVNKLDVIRASFFTAANIINHIVNIKIRDKKTQKGENAYEA